MSNKIPLVVDLDHTLIDTDLLYESSIAVMKKNPLLLLLYPFWFLRGKGYLKEQLVKRFTIDVATLPYNQQVIDYIKQRKKQGAKIILATASHKDYASQIVQYLQMRSHKESVVSNKQNLDLFAEKTEVLKTKSTQGYLFNDMMASNASFNLSSHNKAKKLIERFGNQGFDYMGDHKRDLPVWRASNLSILVNVSQYVIRKTQHLNTLILPNK